MQVIGVTSNSGSSQYSGTHRFASGLHVWTSFTSIVLVKLGLILMISVVVNGQSETGQISGRVTDPRNGRLANVVVKVKSVATGSERTATTNAEGAYTFTSLLPGLYDVAAELAGFASSGQRVDLSVGGKLSVDLQLSLVEIRTETVTVVSNPMAEVNTHDQQLSNVITATQLRDLPSLTRNPYDFVNLSGNIATDPGGSTVRGVGASINGQRAAGTNILLDGGENVNTFTATVGQGVPLESVQEYRVITSNFSAEYGRASGGIVNLVTRSGANEFHGGVFAFNRVSSLASNSFDSNANSLPKDRFTRNQFGYSFGGPIVKNKLFFFSSTEWTRVRSLQNVINLVPTAELISASNSATQTFFANYQLATPINGTVYTVGDIVSTVGASNFSATNAFSNLPSTLPAFGQVRFTVPADVGAGSPQNTYQSVNRIDFNLSDKTQIYGRFAIEKNYFFLGTVNYSPYQGFNTGETDFNQNYLVSMTHAFSPNLVSQSKLVFNRLNQLQPLGEQEVGPTLYLTGVTNQRLAGYLLSLPGYSQFTPGNAIPFGGPQNLGQFYQELNYNWNKHQFRFGGNILYTQDNRMFGAYQNAVEQLSSSVGGGLNNLVLGQLLSFQAAVYPQGQYPGGTLQLPVGQPDFTRSNRYRDGSFYFNDSWRVRPRLILNLGMRYEYYGVQHNKDQSLDSNFYFGSGSNIFEQIRNGSVMTTPESSLGALYAPDKNNFAPRIGFAWDVTGDGRTALRGGYGIAYERNFGNVTYNVIQNPPNYAVVSLVAGTDVTSIPITLSNSGPLAGTTGTKILPVTSLRYVRNDLETAYAQLWSFALERELLPGTVASLEYSGSHGIGLYSIENLNRTGSGLYYLGSTTARPDTGGQTSRLNGQYSNINTRGNGGFSHYNGLTASLVSGSFRKDLGPVNLSGLQFTARYTYAVAKDNLSSTFSEGQNGSFGLGLLDPFNPRLDYGYADSDVRHRFTSSFNWNLPFGRNLRGAARHALGGWTMNGIFVARTGTPFSVYDCTNAITVCMRARLTGAVDFDGSGTLTADPTIANRFQYIDLSGLLSGAGTFTDISGGTEVGPYPSDMSARNAFRGPGSWNFDVGIHKNFHLSEKYTLQLRSEFYNILNHSNLYVVYTDADVSSSTYVPVQRGVRPDGSTERRNVQLAVKLLF